MSSRKRGKGQLAAFTPMLHSTMDTAAWKALTPAARNLFLLLKRLAGYNGDKNGSLFFSVRDAAREMCVHRDTAAKAFHDLQAKGFIVPVKLGALGVTGEGRATVWRVTELGTQGERRPTKEFERWQEGCDFAVQKARAPSPKKQKPVLKNRTACTTEPDVYGEPVLKNRTACTTEPDVLRLSDHRPVRNFRTHKELPGGVG